MRLLIPLFVCLWLLGGCGKEAADSFKPGTGTGTGGSLARFTIVGNYLYTVDKENLKVFDISNPAQPAFQRSVPVGFQIETIFPFKDKLFIGSTTVVHIFSITDGTNPQKLAEAISPTIMRRCDPVVAKDTVAYATLRTTGECGGTQSILAVFNIKDATKPVQVATAPVVEPYGLGYAGNTLYVCDHGAGLVLFDISKAFEPVEVKTIQLSGSKFIDVFADGNLLVCWITDGMALYEISDPHNPVFLKKVN